MTRFSFYVRASMHAHERFMTSNLSFKTIMYAIEICIAVGRRVDGSWQMCARQAVGRRVHGSWQICTAVGRCVHGSWQAHACLSGTHTPKLDYACMQIVNQGQQNKLYEHVVHIQRYDSPRDTRCKSR